MWPCGHRQKEGRNSVGCWCGRRKDSSSGTTEMEASATVAQCATMFNVGGTATLVAHKAEYLWLSGSVAVPLQAGEGTRAKFLETLILDGTTVSWANWQATVSRGDAMGAEVWAGRIPGADRRAE